MNTSFNLLLAGLCSATIFCSVNAATPAFYIDAINIKQLADGNPRGSTNFPPRGIVKDLKGGQKTELLSYNSQDSNPDFMYMTLVPAISTAGEYTIYGLSLDLPGIGNCNYDATFNVSAEGQVTPVNIAGTGLEPSPCQATELQHMEFTIAKNQTTYTFNMNYVTSYG
jgi:hypothetical protein